jgi:hypothetical protein
MLVDQAAQTVSALHVPGPDGRSVYRFAWAPLLQPLVRSRLAVVLDEFLEHAIQMPPTEDQQVIQALSPRRPHPALGERVRPRRSCRCPHHLHAFTPEHLIEGAACVAADTNVLLSCVDTLAGGFCCEVRHAGEASCLDEALAQDQVAVVAAPSGQEFRALGAAAVGVGDLEAALAVIGAMENDRCATSASLGQAVWWAPQSVEVERTRAGIVVCQEGGSARELTQHSL